MSRILHGHACFSTWFLVVIDQFNINCVGFFKTKHDTRVGPHCHGPKPLQIAFQRVKTIAGEIKRLRCSRPIKDGQKLLTVSTRSGRIPRPSPRS